jgi:hypothetical protein
MSCFLPESKRPLDNGSLAKGKVDLQNAFALKYSSTPVPPNPRTKVRVQLFKPNPIPIDQLVHHLLVVLLENNPGADELRISDITTKWSLFFEKQARNCPLEVYYEDLARVRTQAWSRRLVKMFSMVTCPLKLRECPIHRAGVEIVRRTVSATKIVAYVSGFRLRARLDLDQRTSRQFTCDHKLHVNNSAKALSLLFPLFCFCTKTKCLQTHVPFPDQPKKKRVRKKTTPNPHSSKTALNMFTDTSSSSSAVSCSQPIPSASAVSTTSTNQQQQQHLASMAYSLQEMETLSREQSTGSDKVETAIYSALRNMMDVLQAHLFSRFI